MVMGNAAKLEGAGAARTGSLERSGPGSRLAVYTVAESEERSIWRRIGAGFVAKDGSINLYLEALPVNGRLHVREIEGLLEVEPAKRDPRGRREG